MMTYCSFRQLQFDVLNSEIQMQKIATFLCAGFSFLCVTNIYSLNPKMIYVTKLFSGILEATHAA